MLCNAVQMLHCQHKLQVFLAKPLQACSRRAEVCSPRQQCRDALLTGCSMRSTFPCTSALYVGLGCLST